MKHSDHKCPGIPAKLAYIVVMLPPSWLVKGARVSGEW